MKSMKLSLLKKKSMKKMKENIRMIKDSDEIDLLSENNNNITE